MPTAVQVKKVVVYPSVHEPVNEILAGELERVQARGIAIEVLRDVGILDEYILLPAIRADEGDLRTGLPSILRFIDRITRD